MSILASIIIILFSIFGLAFLFVFLCKTGIFLFKIATGSISLGALSTIASLPTLARKWWAWLIQLPILFFQITIFMKNQAGQGILLIIIFQIISSIIIFNVQRIIQKDF